jgi:hypothetical protein
VLAISNNRRSIAAEAMGRSYRSSSQNSPRLFFLKDGVAHLRHCFRQSVLLEAALGFRLQSRRSLQQLLAMSTHLDEASPGRTKNASLSGKPE